MPVRKSTVLLAAALLLAACTKTGTSSAPAEGQRHPWTVPHVLRYATAEDITGLNPHLSSQQTVSFMSSLTMAWLVKTGPDSRPVPELATEVPTKQNGGISADGRTITYHLRRDAKWSDGVPFDADDVVFSVKTVLNPANNELSRDGWDYITKIDEPDKYTVVLHLSRPYSPYAVTFFASSGANPCVLPKHILGKLANINNAPYNALPVGIGPFKYTSWKRADSVEMVANPLYFRGRPKLDKVVFKVVPDRNTVLTQLTTHELDMWPLVSANYYDRAKALAGITVLRQPAFMYDHMDFNVSHPVVADPVVRRALRYGVDRETIREKIRHGLGTLSDNVFGTNHPAYHPIPLTPFDLAKGNALLDGAGWKRGADGVRSKNGVRLVLEVAVPSGTPDTDSQVELIRQSWNQLGARINLRHYPDALFFALAQNGGIVYGGKFDVVFFAWTLDSFGSLYPLYGCDMVPPKGQNDARWCDAKANAAMIAFDREYDEAKRNPYDYVVTDRIAEQVPIIVMDIRDSIAAYNSDLKNWHPNPVAPFDDMMNVDI